MKCPPGTTNNINKTACLGTDYAYFDDKTFYLRYITGRGPTEREYTKGICNTQASKFYCYQTFYGPLSGENKEFYISVLNPSELQLPSIDYYYKPTVSYAYAVIKRIDLAKIDENSQNSCSSTENIISLGTVVSGINVINNGFKINYISGDVCDKNKNTYSMQLNMICDKNAMNGWPSYNNTQGCNYNFV